MIRHVFMASLIYACAAIQPAIGIDFRSFVFQPWLPCLALVLSLHWFQQSVALFWVAVLGLVVDCLSGSRLGIHLIAAVMTASSLGFVQAVGKPINVSAISMSVFVTTVLWRGGATLALGLIDHQPIEVSAIAFELFCDGASTTVVALLFLLPIRIVRTPSRPRSTAPIPLTNRWSMLTGG